jgi:predicted transcriptional regulator
MHAASLTAADVMNSGIKTVSPRMTLPELEESFQRDRVTGYPVVEHAALVGVVSRSDVIRQLCTERHVAETVSDFFFDERDFYELKMESLQQIADRVGERIESLSVADVMEPDPLTVPLDLPIREVAKRFLSHSIHRLPVVDRADLVGIITTMDLAELIAQGRLVEA